MPADFVGLSYEVQQPADPSFFAASNIGLIRQFKSSGASARTALTGGLLVLYAPESQVDAWLSHRCFLGHFVLEGLLRVTCHD
jgi:hypothetical protein